MASASSENFFCFEQEDLLTKSLTKFQDFRKNGIFCDVVVKAGDQEFSAHRNVLAAAIPYFYTMFTSEDMDKQIELVLKGIDASALEALIDFSYSGKIKIDPQNVQKLMSAAHCFNLNQVKDACADFLTAEIQADNVLGIIKLANLLNCKKLLSAADKFINENFPEIAGSNEFLMLDFEDLKQLIENDRKNCAEEIVFDAAIKWVKHKEVERKSYLPKILLKVRLSLVSIEFLVNVVNREELIWSSFDCLRIVDKTKTYHLMQWANEIQNVRSLPKLSNLAHTLHGTQIMLYDVTKNEWLLQDVPLNGDESGSTVLSLASKIYVIGGKGSYESKVDIYDLKTKLWSKGRDMINGRSELATTLNDCIYINGGNDNEANKLSSVHCYSVKENSWKSVVPMIKKRSHLGVISLNGFIYAIGGFDEKYGAVNYCGKYDPTSNADTWTIIKSLNIRRFGAGVASLNNKIYACGGNDNDVFLNSCEVYDPAIGTWSMVAPMNGKRYKFSLKSFNGKLYAVGGFNEKGFISSVEVFSPETNSWETLTQNS